MEAKTLKSKTMNRVRVALLLLTSLAAANASAAVDSDDADGKSPARSSKLQGPVQIDYQIIGTPIVGQPVAVELRLRSTLGDHAYKLSYRINDPTAMQLPETQLSTVSVAPVSGEELSVQQVTVVPLREGRLYLNVAAVVETEGGSMQTVVAVPIQVGAAAPREILDNGTLQTDADGNRIHSLPASEN